MANTTLNPSDKSAGVTLTGGNLIGTSNAPGNYARAVDQQITGKFYFEMKPTVWGNSSTCVGICPGPAILAVPSPSSATQMTIVARNGIIFSDGASTGISLGTRAANDVIGIAVDFDARLIWFRVAPSGNWNASASANPATGAGGITTTLSGRGIPAFPVAGFGANLESISANFGDAAFTGAVPSGFTSGFTTGLNNYSTVLLLHADGTNGSTTFTDSSFYNSAATARGTATVSTTSPKFGTGSLDNGATPASAGVTFTGVSTNFQFGARPFTIEAWIYFTATPSGIQSIISMWQTGDLAWNLRMSSGTLAFLYSTTGSDSPGISAAFTPTLNTWYHVAADRDAANMLRLYVDGAVIASASAAATIFASSTSPAVGNEFALTRGFPGRIDEVRVTKDYARYGGAFTLPTSPFSAYVEINALASQSLAEHWLTVNADAQVTQMLIEHWATTTSTGLQAVVTQVALEHWASVANFVPSTGGPMVTMIW